MDVITAIAIIGIIILLGFVGAVIFERTKIPDVLLLLLIGLVLGPVFNHYLNIEFMSASMLEFIAPYLGALALIIILFDGGLDLNYEKVMRHLGVSVLHTTVIFIVNITLIAVLFHFVVGFPLAIAVLLGAVISGTSSAIVIPLLAGTSATEDTRTILVLESVLTDVMCIVSVLTVISILKGGDMDIGSISSNLLQPFAVAGMVGGLFAVLWLYVLKWFEGKRYAFMITIAALFVLYSFTEYVKASGAIAVLVFGLVLSNRDEFQRIFRLRTRFVLDKKISEFHDELTFVIRTFFFVYTGMVFSFVLPESANIPAFVPTYIASNPAIFFAFIMVILVVILVLSRLPGSFITTRIRKSTKNDLGIMAVMLPGGLTAAVLAQVPFTVPEYIAAGTTYHNALEPYRAMFVNTVFVIIVTSVVITTICVFLIEYRRMSKNITVPQSRRAIVKEAWAARSRMYSREVKEMRETEWSSSKQMKQWQESSRPANVTQTHPRDSPHGTRTRVLTPVSQKPREKTPQATAKPANHHQKPQPLKPTPRAKPANPKVQTSHTEPAKPAPKPVNTPRPAIQTQQKSHRLPYQPQTRDHPLVKRTAESEKALPKKTVDVPAKEKQKK